MEDLLNKLNAHKGEFNVSLTVPIEHTTFAKGLNQERVKSAIKEATNKVLIRRADYNFISSRLNDLYEKIGWDHPMKGIGLFVSPAISEWVYFPNPVIEKIIVGESFETRDLIYEISRLKIFWTLILSKNHVRLFHCKGEKAEEISDECFPLKYIEEFDFDQPPSRARSTEGIEDSQVKEIREREFLRKVDNYISLYLKKEKGPLIIGGTIKVLSLFTGVTKNNKSIIAQMPGNFDYQSLNEIISAAWNKILKWQNQEKDEILIRLKQANGSPLCVHGIKNVWRAALQGKCDTLVVEKDFMHSAMLDDDLFEINDDGEMKYMSPHMEDVVNNIINLVKERKGKVVFTDNNQLSKYERIACFLRY